MKRYFTSPTANAELILTDTVVITVELPLLENVNSTEVIDLTNRNNLDKFRQDVADIMINEFNFNILEEDVLDDNGQSILDENGDKIKVPGHVTNRDDSISLYYGVSYDIVESNKWAQDNLIPRDKAVSIKCKVIVKVTDHPDDNQNSTDSRRYFRGLKDDIDKKFGPHDIDLDGEQPVKISPQIYRDYRAGLQEVRHKLQDTIFGWRLTVSRILKRRSKS